MDLLRASSLGFYRVWLAAVGERHGLFPRLVRPASPATLARATRLDPAMLARWCASARAVGLLEEREGRYRLPRGFVPALAKPDDAAYLGHHFRYLADKSLGFGALDDLLQGKRVRVDASHAYDEATRWDHLAFFEVLLPRAPALRQALAGGADVLDLGAGSGGWTALARERFPRARIVAADVDAAALRRARRRLGAASVRHAARLPVAGFDVAFLGEVLAAAKDPAAPLRTARRALREGGRLVLLEGLRAEHAPRRWGERLVGAMDFDFALDGSRYLDLAEVEKLLRDAGFARVRSRDLGGSLFAVQAVATGTVKRAPAAVPSR